MVSWISLYILVHPGIYVMFLKTQLRVNLRYPASMACYVITSGYSFFTILMTGRCSHYNSLKWLPECANTWVTCWVLLRSMRSAVIFTSPVSSGSPFIVVFCLIKVLIFCLSSDYFHLFFLFYAPFVGEKGYITVVFFFQKVAPWHSLEFNFLLDEYEITCCFSYTFKNDPYLIFDATLGQIWDSCRRQIVVFFCDKSTPSCMSKIFTFFKIGLVVKTISVLTTVAAVIFSN